jgi:hypothetical protein
MKPAEGNTLIPLKELCIVAFTDYFGSKGNAKSIGALKIANSARFSMLESKARVRNCPSRAADFLPPWG